MLIKNGAYLGWVDSVSFKSLESIRKFAKIVHKGNGLVSAVLFQTDVLLAYAAEHNGPYLNGQKRK